MRKILVTGGCGYIGDAVVEKLLYHNDNPNAEPRYITILDNLTYGGAYLRFDPHLTFIRGDVTDKELIESLVPQFDVVIHLAAIVGDGACSVNPSRTIDVNENSTKHIAELCAEHDIVMIFASTCSVYGMNNDMLDEMSPTSPLSLYAGAKLNSEEYVVKVPNHYIFRLGTLFGHSTQHARLRCDLVANILTFKALQGDKLTVFGGEQWRPLLHVRNAADAMVFAAMFGTTGLACGYRGIHNLSYKNFKIIDIANEIIEVCNLDPTNSIEVTDMKFEDLRNYKVSIEDRNKHFLKTVHKITLKEGIQELVDISPRISNYWDRRFHNAKYIKDIYE